MLRRVLIASFIVALSGAFLIERQLAHTRSVSSTSKLILRVMTYNIHVGIGMDKKMDLQRIADVINHELLIWLACRKSIAA